MKKSILVVEDEKRINDIICDYLDAEGYDYIKAFDGMEALRKAKDNHIDVIILDIMMPKLDGFAVLKNIRQHSDVLVVILSARSDEDDKLTGFELGADEYVTKPFSPKVLVARINALLKRFDDENSDIVNYGILHADIDSYHVSINDEEIKLTSREYELLFLLMKNSGRILTRDYILDTLWGIDYTGDGRVLDTTIKTLRRKLEDASKYIGTVIGIGYKFEVIL